jgi:Pyruvate/2-oxoacid:ferredoxin oxidoreductase delta subunit
MRLPNTYVCLPGFDIDNPSTEHHKLVHAHNRLGYIAHCINHRIHRVFRLRHGILPNTKSYVLRPLFRHLLTGDKPFHTTAECIACGLCVRTCPLQNITLDNGHPRWHGHCTDCLACYHICPQHAIRYGKRTNHKGQYHMGEKGENDE